MTAIKGIFKRLIKYRILTVLISIILFFLISLIVLTIIGTIYQISILKEISSIMGTPVALFSSFIALLLPFILISVQNNRKLEKKKEIRVKCYNAIDRICDFCIKQFSSKTNSPKDNIAKENRMEIIEPIEILNMYKGESLEMGIILSSGWEKKVDQQLHIFIFVNNLLEIQLISPSYGRVIHATMTYKGDYIKNKDEVAPILNSLSKKIQSF